jgi:hypothetical protein
MVTKVIPNGLLRGAMMIALVALLAGVLPKEALAAEGGDNSYESASYGFSLTWDDTIWTADTSSLSGKGSDGVQLSSDYSFVMIMATGGQDVDPDACIENLEGLWRDSSGIEDFKAAPRKSVLPESALGGEQALFTMTMQDPDGPIEMMDYLECLPIQDGQAALTVSMITSAENYTYEIPAWEDLLAGIDPGSAAAADTTDDQSGDATDAAGGSYSDPAGYTVTYDTDVWTGTPLENESGIELDSGSTLLYVRTLGADDDLEYCPTDIAGELQADDTFGRMRNAPASMGRPETVDDAVAGLWTANATDSLSKYVIFVECRPLNSDNFLAIIALVDDADYADELPAIQTVLDGVTIDIESSTDSGKSHPRSHSPSEYSVGKQNG